MQVSCSSFSVRLLDHTYWDLQFSLLESKDYWIRVLNGPYELKVKNHKSILISYTRNPLSEYKYMHK